MVLFFDLFAQEHGGGFGEHGLFIGTKLGIVGSHECHCACYIAVCEDRGDGEGVGGDTLDGSKRLGCGIGIVKGFAVFQSGRASGVEVRRGAGTDQKRSGNPGCLRTEG